MKEFSNKDINDLTGIAFMGIEFPMPKLCYLKIDDIFPLVKLKFEDMECYAPKNYKDFLYRNYGDYMKPQIDGEMYHFDKTKFSYDNIKYMQNFISNT